MRYSTQKRKCLVEPHDIGAEFTSNKLRFCEIFKERTIAAQQASGKIEYSLLNANESFSFSYFVFSRALPKMVLPCAQSVDDPGPLPRVGSQKKGVNRGILSVNFVTVS